MQEVGSVSSAMTQKVTSFNLGEEVSIYLNIEESIEEINVPNVDTLSKEVIRRAMENDSEQSIEDIKLYFMREEIKIYYF